MKRLSQKHRNTVDFAQILKYTLDVLYPRTEKIVLVTDNLNIHAEASQYKAFKLEEARRLAERFEWYYTRNMGAGWTWLKLRLGLWAARRLQNRFRTWKALRNRSASGQSNEMQSVKK